MKLLRVHAEGTDRRLADSIGRAVNTFNGALDIRLRFLAIGVEEVVVELDGGTQSETTAGDAAEAIGRVLAASHFDVALLLGGGAKGLAAAATVVRAKVPLVRLSARPESSVRGEDDASPSRGIDHLASAHLVSSDADLKRLREEGIVASAEVIGAALDPVTGERVLGALLRRRHTC